MPDGVDVYRTPSREAWLKAVVNSKTYLIAYIPGEIDSTSALWSVFWRGRFDRERFFDVMRTAENFAQKLSDRSEMPVEGQLVAFGQNRAVRNSQDSQDRRLSSYFDNEEMREFEAYRADFTIKSKSFVGEVSVWGNVAESDDRTVGEAGENIGLGLSAYYLHDIVSFKFVRQVIQLTSGIPEAIVTKMFTAISTELSDRVSRRVGLTYPR